MSNIFGWSNKWSWHNCRIICYQHIIGIQKKQKVFLGLKAQHISKIEYSNSYPHLIQEKLWWHFFCDWMFPRIDEISHAWCFKLIWLLKRLELNLIYKWWFAEVINTLLKIFNVTTLLAKSLIYYATDTFDRNH